MTRYEENFTLSQELKKYGLYIFKKSKNEILLYLPIIKEKRGDHV